ncbi:MAG: hypothetical protein MUC44_00005 [Beijerinckiaceae bacterium]|jgi:DNA invertase Pin-like site-specific DNA recombinase|nr:hypothetical protein [Beijerinckiaceae bacterium]
MADMSFIALEIVSEVERDLIRPRTCEAVSVARVEGKPKFKMAEAEQGVAPDA